MPRSFWALGSAMFTIDPSSTIISWAAASTASAHQRRGSGASTASVVDAGWVTGSPSRSGGWAAQDWAHHRAHLRHSYRTQPTVRLPPGTRGSDPASGEHHAAYGEVGVEDDEVSAQPGRDGTLAVLDPEQPGRHGGRGGRGLLDGQPDLTD